MGWGPLALAVLLFGVAALLYRAKKPGVSPRVTRSSLPWDERWCRTGAAAIAWWRGIVLGVAVISLMMGYLMHQTEASAELTQLVLRLGGLSAVLWLLSEVYFAGLCRIERQKLREWYYPLVAYWAIVIPAVTTAGIYWILRDSRLPASLPAQNAPVIRTVTVVKTGPISETYTSTDGGPSKAPVYGLVASGVYALVIVGVWGSLLVIPLMARVEGEE